MISIYSDRLVMKSNSEVINGKIQYPKNKDKDEKEDKKEIDIFNIRPTNEGFIFYDKNNKETTICHIGIRCDRKPMEISYGVEEAYRNKKYMQEALTTFINWIFTCTDTQELNALIVNNAASLQIILKHKFKYFGEGQTVAEKWYVLNRDSWFADK